MTHRVLAVIALIVQAAVLVAAISPYPVPIGPPSLDCKVRELAYEFAQQLQPQRGNLQSVYDALTLQNCNVTVDDTKKPESTAFPPTFPTPDGSSSLYVDSSSGSDSNPGTISAPLKTISAAVQKGRTLPKPVTVLVRGGVYFLNDAIKLGVEDSGLTIQNYNGENVEVSGGFDLGTLDWVPYNVSNASMVIVESSNNVYSLPPSVGLYGKTNTAEDCAAACQANSSCMSFTWHSINNPQPWPYTCYLRTDSVWDPMDQANHTSGYKIPAKNIYVAKVSVPDFTGLRLPTTGKRAIRARFPNGDPELQLFPDGWISQFTYAAPRPLKSATTVQVTSPNRTDLAPSFDTYIVGVGGSCENFFSPPGGYWCLDNPPRGSSYRVQVPSGLTYSAGILDHGWASFRPNKTVVNAFRDGHWFSYAFLVDEIDQEKDFMSWTVGGFQGGEGCNVAAEWNIENIFEELDFPGEWYYSEESGELFLFHNDTGAPPATGFVATNLTQLFIIQGTPSAPVLNITIRGLHITGAALSYFEPHGLPSDGGGDWALARNGAVFIEGAEGTVIDSCLFERLDGNGVMISGYNRGTTVQNSEFVWIGENAIASWGYTQDLGGRTDRLPYGMGIDGTDGNHPQGNVIFNNFIHEIGHFQKQVSCYFQAQTQGTTLERNICFNGPRAGINFNDGMGGGNTILFNLVFNMVRETQDHGSFNSWDRMPFLTLQDGEATFVPKYNNITRNFMVNNYNPQEAIDNDDGSAYYETSYNFFPYSTNGMKNDFDGHDNHHHNNIYYNDGGCMSICEQNPGHSDMFYNNTCIMTGSGDYASFQGCTQARSLPVMHDNNVYTPTGTATECGMSIAQWQKMGHDLGTTVSKLPSDDFVIALARQVLMMD